MNEGSPVEPEPIARQRSRARRVIITTIACTAGAVVLSAPIAAPLLDKILNDATPSQALLDAPALKVPQVVLTNRAKFRGHSGLGGASSFLVEHPKTKTPLFVTARHLIGAAGGVEPEVTIETLDNKLDAWFAFPRTATDAVQVADIGIEGLADTSLDILVLHVKAHGRYPAKLLTVRKEPPVTAEIVHLMGCQYVDRTCKQKDWAGEVWEVFDGRFSFGLREPADLRGFSGAPILDAEGRVIGLLSGSVGEPIDDSSRYRGGIGTGMAPLFRRLTPTE